MTILRLNDQGKVTTKKSCATFGPSNKSGCHHRPSAIRIGNYAATTNHHYPRPEHEMLKSAPQTPACSNVNIIHVRVQDKNRNTTIVTPNKKLRPLRIVPANDNEYTREVRSPLASLLPAEKASSAQSPDTFCNNRVSIVGLPSFTVPIKFRGKYNRPPSPTSSMTMMDIDNSSSTSEKDVILDDQSEEQKEVVKSRRRVNFVPTVKVTEIPHRRMYTMGQHYQMYNNSMTIRNMAQRNLIEYNYEGRNWRYAVEEESFVQSYYDGSLIHPAHVPVYSNNNNSRHPSSTMNAYDCPVNC